MARCTAHKTRLWMLLLGVAALLAVPAVASAHRKATRSEKSAMIYHARSRYDHLTAKQVDMPKAFPLQCAQAVIATVVPGSRWGVWAFDGRMYYRRRKCRRWASNGWVMEHTIGRRWYVVIEWNERPAHVPGVPDRVAHDLLYGLH